MDGAYVVPKTVNGNVCVVPFEICFFQICLILDHFGKLRR